MIKRAFLEGFLKKTIERDMAADDRAFANSFTPHFHKEHGFKDEQDLLDHFSKQRALFWENTGNHLLDRIGPEDMLEVYKAQAPW